MIPFAIPRHAWAARRAKGWQGDPSRGPEWATPVVVQHSKATRVLDTNESNGNEVMSWQLLYALTQQYYWHRYRFCLVDHVAKVTSFEMSYPLCVA